MLEQDLARLVHHVDEAGRDVAARRVDLAGAARPDRADPGDAAVLDRDVGADPGIAGAVEHPAVADDDVVSRLGRLRCRRQASASAARAATSGFTAPPARRRRA